MKIYPQLKEDDGGIKFCFDVNNKHYTLRFAGNPLILIEGLYTLMGGDNFIETYNKLKHKEKVDTDDKTNMEAAMRLADTFLQALTVCNQPPFVVYVYDYDENRINDVDNNEA